MMVIIDSGYEGKSGREWIRGENKRRYKLNGEKWKEEIYMVKFRE